MKRRDFIKTAAAVAGGIVSGLHKAHLMKRFFAYLLLVLLLTLLSAGTKAAASGQDEFATTVAYVSQFYPLWFTYYQASHATPNRNGRPNLRRLLPNHADSVAFFQFHARLQF